MILLDTSGLLSALDASQRHHAMAVSALRAAQPPLLLSPFVLDELGYLLATRVGVQAELALLQEVADRAYQLEQFDADDVELAREHILTYADQEIGLADASIVVLADRHDLSDVLTLDERHFRTIRRRSGQAFRLLPADIDT